jgi:1-acyl-sn-glycerol-3-phosphate acyltransferase
MRRVLLWLLHRENLDDWSAVGEPPRDRQMERMGLPRRSPPSALGAMFGDKSYFPVMLYRAQQALKRGEIVVMAPDGHHGGTAGVKVPIFGRELSIRTGFAELALRTGAPIAPVAVTIDDTGHLNVEFLPFLDPSGPTHQARVESLARQYVEVLRKEWSANLGNANWAYLRRFMRFPSVSSSPGQEASSTALEEQKVGAA